MPMNLATTFAHWNLHVRWSLGNCCVCWDFVVMKLAQSEVVFAIVQLKWLAIMSFDSEAYADVRLTFVMTMRRRHRVHLDAVAMTIAYFVDESGPSRTSQYWPVLNSMVVLNSLDKLFADAIRSLSCRKGKKCQLDSDQSIKIWIEANDLDCIGATHTWQCGQKWGWKPSIHW